MRDVHIDDENNTNLITVEEVDELN